MSDLKACEILQQSMCNIALRIVLISMFMCFSACETLLKENDLITPFMQFTTQTSSQPT